MSGTVPRRRRARLRARSSARRWKQLLKVRDVCDPLDVFISINTHTNSLSTPDHIALVFSPIRSSIQPTSHHSNRLTHLTAKPPYTTAIDAGSIR